VANHFFGIIDLFLGFAGIKNNIYVIFFFSISDVKYLNFDFKQIYIFGLQE